MPCGGRLEACPTTTDIMRMRRQITARRIDLRSSVLHAHFVQNSATLLSFLQQQLPSALEMLRRMVGINSFTNNRAGVNRVGGFTAECFAEHCFHAEFAPSTNPALGDHLVL